MSRAALLAAAFLALWPAVALAEITVFAAASLKNALDEIAAEWGGADITFSYGGSSALARQIALGAPADVYVSASAAWVDELEASGDTLPESRVVLARNALVFIGAEAGAPLDPITPGALRDRIGGGRLAMALVQAVPAGIYGKAALTSLDLWEGLAPQVVQADNVRAALALVATGAVPYGIVYVTDAESEPRVTTLGAFDPGLHPPIVYPAALTSRAGAEAAAFLDHLTSAAGQAVFAAHGFQPAAAP